MIAWRSSSPRTSCPPFSATLTQPPPSHQVVVATCEPPTLLRYGGGQQRHIVYLLYTGQHYDPLIGPPPSSVRKFAPDGALRASRQREAPRSDEALREDEARRIAQQHHQESERQAIERSLPVGAMATMSLSGATHSYTHAPS